MIHLHKNAVQGTGNIWASVVADSISPWNDRLTTFRLHYPRMIHSEFMTHRMFSRNAASSRAIPVYRMIEQVVNNPAMPIYWGENQAGMQAGGVINTNVLLKDCDVTNDECWVHAANSAAYYAKALHNAKYHKQVVNRLLEPFQFMNTVVSATDINNFFWLRCHSDADPIIQELAQVMYEAYSISVPLRLKNEDECHTPYVNRVRDPISGKLRYYSGETEIGMERARKVSVSCCAQASYRKLDTSIEKASSLFDKIVSAYPLHASTLEHVASPFGVDEYTDRELAKTLLTRTDVPNPDMVMYSGNFRGWSQYRKSFPTENNNSTFTEHKD